MAQPTEPQPDTPEPAPLPPTEPPATPVDEPHKGPPQTALTAPRRRVGIVLH